MPKWFETVLKYALLPLVGVALGAHRLEYR